MVLSVFQSAAVLLARDAGATPRDRAKGAAASGEPLPAPPHTLMMAVRAGRQVCLVAETLLITRLLSDVAVPFAALWAFLAVLVVFVLLMDQLAAGSLARLDPRKAYGATLFPARVLASPLAPLVSPIQELLGFILPRAAGEPGSPFERGAEEIASRAAEGELIENVVEFTGTVVREVMTPRTEMVAIEEGAPLRDLVELVVRSNRSRLPVTRGDADHVVGIIHARDLLSLWRDPPSSGGLEPLIRPVMAVPESKRAVELLREMQASGAQMAIVVDEYGGTAGLVTVEDLLEELVGEIADEHELLKPPLTPLGDGSWLVHGSFPVYDLAERLGVTLPEVEADTVGGLVVALLGRLPEPGEGVDVAGLRLEVSESDRRRVRRVRVRPAAPAPAGP